jgi:hypothetical protein
MVRQRGGKAFEGEKNATTKARRAQLTKKRKRRRRVGEEEERRRGKEFSHRGTEGTEKRGGKQEGMLEKMGTGNIAGRKRLFTAGA